jgi:hypothetical protein
VRYWSVFLFLSAGAGSASSRPPRTEAVAQLERDGRPLFVACDFKRATRLELIRPAECDPKPWLREIADSRKEHSGPGWGMRRWVPWTPGAIGRIVPER